MKGRVYFVSVLAVLGGCDLSGFSDSVCVGVGGQSVAGEWRIRGGGVLSECENELQDGEVEIGALNLQVTRDAAGEYVLENPSNPKFSLNGVTESGGDVRFETSEETETGTVSLAFDGAFTGCGEVEGTFEGTGPAGCLIEGNFTLSIESSDGSGGEGETESDTASGEDVVSSENDASEETREAGESSATSDAAE